MENPNDSRQDQVPDTGAEHQTSSTAHNDTETVAAFAQDAFASAKETVMDVAERAKAFFKEKADQTDLDEKAAEFARKAAGTAKDAVNTAAEKTRDFVEKNDLDEKARAFAQEASERAKTFGQTVSEKAREWFDDTRKHFDDGAAQDGGSTPSTPDSSTEKTDDRVDGE